MMPHSLTSSRYSSVANHAEDVDTTNEKEQAHATPGHPQHSKVAGTRSASTTTTSSGNGTPVDECSWLQLAQKDVPSEKEDRESVLSNDEITQNQQLLRQARILLYSSHFFSQFAEGAWQFAVILFLAAVTHYHSILLVSTYYLTTYASSFAFGAPLGRFVDRANRLVAARVCILVQNGSVLAATACCCWLLTKTEKNNVDNNDVPHDALSLVLIVGLHIFGSVAQALDQAFVVAIERDWIVVLSQQVQVVPSHDEENNNIESDGSSSAAESWLSGTNVALRQIDLTCKVVAPAVAGLVVGQASSSDATTTTDNNTGVFCDMHGAAVLVGILNVTALLVEFICTAKIYHLFPALAIQQGSSSKLIESNKSDVDADTHSNTCGVAEIRETEKTNGYQEEDRKTDKIAYREEEEMGAIPNHSTNGSTKTSDGGSSLWHGLVVYMEQSVAWGGVGLAITYLNALSFGGYMTAFLLFKGMSVEEVGIWRSIASVTGLLGTFAYQLSTKYTSVVNTGELSILYLFACLSLALASFLIKDDKYGLLSVYLLVITCALSRIGLWVFDICVTLLFQEFVPDGVRGLVGGTQQAMNSFFVVLVGCMGLFVRRPEDFYIFAAVSYLGICICAVTYTFGIFRRRHLFQMAID